MRTIHRDIVSALLISSDNKLFMGMKDPSKGGVYAECWHIPGGGIDEGEDKIEALARELLEETGINIAKASPKLVSDSGTGTSTRTLKDGETVVCEMSFYVYEVKLKKPSTEIEISLNDDLVKFVWADLDELSKYALTPPSVKLFKKLNYF